MPIDMRMESAEVYYRTGDIRTVTPNDIEFLKANALTNPRKRCRICMHNGPQDSIHEMVIVHHRDAYVRPHAHKSRGESLQVLAGRATAVFFNDLGTVTQKISLAAPGEGDPSRPYFYRTNPGAFHALLIESEWLVFHEMTSGPFRRDDTLFPAWAPDSDDEAKGVAWLRAQIAR